MSKAKIKNSSNKKQNKSSNLKKEIAKAWKQNKIKLLISSQSKKNQSKSSIPEFCHDLSINPSVSVLEKIGKIKIKFGFKAEFNLLSALQDSLNWYVSEISIMRRSQPPSQLRKIYGQILNKLNGMSEIPGLLEKLGVDGRSHLIEKIYTLPIFTEKELQGVNLIHHVEGWITDNEKNIAKLSGACSRLEKISLKKQESQSLTQRFISHLGWLYEQGTGKKPICEWNREKEKIMGNFHLFVIGLHPILKEVCFIDLGENSSIEEYAKRCWRDYKKILQRPQKQI